MALSILDFQTEMVVQFPTRDVYKRQMKHKHTHYIYASFALLLFVALGYMVKFYPEALTAFDSNIQTWVRGDLPAGLTRFFKTITILGNTPVQAIIAIVAVIWLYLRQYKACLLYTSRCV